jgi:hypothetical protein
MGPNANTGEERMRTSLLAMVVVLGTAIGMPAVAQQQTTPNPQMQDEADKGVKTRNSGDSGYVAEQEKPGASTHAPGQPDKSQTTGSAGGASSTGSGTGDRSR